MEILNDYYAAFSKYFDSENLVSLSDNNHNFMGLNTMDLLSFNKENKKFPKFDKFKTLRDIKNCNNDLKLFTAQLFLYHPHINNPLNEFKFINNKKSFTYFQNSADWIYCSYVSVCFEKLYNFWDRIGDTLAFYLDLEIKPFNVGFVSAIAKMDKLGTYKSDPNFIPLLEFKNNEFKEFNQHRVDVVHYYQFETVYRDLFEVNNSNQQEIEKIWKWKYDMPVYFKEHLYKSCVGYYNMINLLKTYE